MNVNEKFTLAQNVDEVQFFIYTYMEGISTTIYVRAQNQPVTYIKGRGPVT